MSTTVVTDNGDDENDVSPAEVTTAVAANDAENSASDAGTSAIEAESSAAIAENSSDIAEDAAELSVTAAAVADSAATETVETARSLQSLIETLPDRIREAVVAGMREAAESATATTTTPAGETQEEITESDQPPGSVHPYFRRIGGKR